ncbi:MAG TPA: MFS transporter [Acetobacteraceae bacterium]|nr:MFS transporter [Acetobacteraceae bacterium]
MAGLFATPDFVRLWLAGGLTNTMRMQEILVAGIFAYQVTGSALAVSLVLMLRALPMLLMGALAGALAESLDRKRLLMSGQAFAALSAFAVALLSATGLLALWHLALSGFISGLVWTNEHATRRRMVAEVAGPHDMVRAVALDTTTGSTTRMIGPLLGGLFFQTLGLTAAYLLAGFAYGAAFLLVRRASHRQEPRTVRPRQLLAEIAAAVRLAWRHPVIRAVLGVTIVMNAFAFSYGAVLPAFGQRVFGASAVEIGILAAAEPAGALLGGLLLASGRGVFSGVWVFLGGSAGFALLLLVASFVPSFLAVALLLFLGGIGIAAFAAHQTALVILDAPAEARSRLLGLITTCIGTGPFGVLAIGMLADGLGPAAAISIMAAAGLAGLALIALSLRRA